MDLLQDYLKNKIVFFSGIIAIALSCLTYVGYKYYKTYELQKTKARQLAGFLSEKERKMTEQKVKFDLAKSTLIASNKALEEEAAEYRTKYTDLNAEFQKFVSENNLKITQYQKRIYSLKQRVKSTKDLKPIVKTIIQKGSCDKETVVHYTYEDPYQRVILKTPNCLERGNEELVLNQKFSIYGEVYKQVNGALKVSRLTLKELNPSDLTQVISTAKLVDSEFKYTTEDDVEKEYSFTFGAGFDSNLNTNLNIGYNTFSFRSLTLNLAVNYIHKQTVHPSVKLLYNPTILGRKTNFGLSAGLGYSFDNQGFFILGVDFGAW